MNSSFDSLDLLIYAIEPELDFCKLSHHFVESTWNDHCNTTLKSGPYRVLTPIETIVDSHFVMQGERDLASQVDLVHDENYYEVIPFKWNVVDHELNR